MGVCNIEWSCLTSKTDHDLENGRQKERLRARGLASTCYLSLCIKSGLAVSGCPQVTVLDMVGWWQMAVTIDVEMQSDDQVMASRVEEVSLNRWSLPGLFVMVKKMVLWTSVTKEHQTKLMDWCRWCAGMWPSLQIGCVPWRFWLRKRILVPKDPEVRDGRTKLTAHPLEHCRVSNAGGGYDGVDGMVGTWEHWRGCPSGVQWSRTSTNGDERWRRWVTGVLIQRTLMWKTLCVPQGGTHRRR